MYRQLSFVIDQRHAERAFDIAIAPN